MWQWLREEATVWAGITGGSILVLYGVVPTFQPAHFGRVYAAYGGVFVVASLLWGWLLDGTAPDRPDLAGATLCLLGVAVLMYWPRA
jgi:small multidrug resistance family-3 protein